MPSIQASSDSPRLRRVFSHILFLLISSAINSSVFADVVLVFDANNNTALDITPPQQIELDRQDNLFIAGFSGDIVRIDRQGNTRQIVAPMSSRPEFSSFYTRLMRIDSLGNIYLGGSFNLNGTHTQGIVRVSPGGAIEVVVDSSLHDLGRRVPNIDYMEIDSNDELLFMIRSTGTVFRLDSNDQVTQVLNTIDGAPVDSNGFIAGFEANNFTLDNADNLLLGGSHTDFIERENGSTYASVSIAIATLSNDGTLTELPAVSLDSQAWPFYSAELLLNNPLGGLYVVSGTGINASVHAWVKPGVSRAVIDVSGDGTGESTAIHSGDWEIPTTYINSGNPLVGPTQATVDRFGNLYVIGANSDNAFLVNADGRVELLLGASGLGSAAKLEYPTEIEVDTSGNIYVLGLGSENIFRVDPPHAESYDFSTPDASRETRFQPPSAASLVRGTESNDTLVGGLGDEILFGLEGDDTFVDLGGSDFIYGGLGYDTADFEFDRNDYALSQDPITGFVEVTSKDGESRVQLSDIESLQFRDVTLATTDLHYWGVYSTPLLATEQVVYRFFNTRRNAFFYTQSAEEAALILERSAVSRNNVDEWPYVFQGSTFDAAHSYAGASDLYRFYNYSTGHHFFTADPEERDHVLEKIASTQWPFDYEGVAFQVYASDPNPDSEGRELAVHRFYSIELNRHFFTADPGELLRMQYLSTWTYEGIRFYGEKPE